MPKTDIFQIEQIQSRNTSGDLNQRITREMSDFLSSLSSQIQRAINEAIKDQILPEIQASIWEPDRAKCPKKGGEAPVR